MLRMTTIKPYSSKLVPENAGIYAVEIDVNTITENGYLESRVINKMLEMKLKHMQYKVISSYYQTEKSENTVYYKHIIKIDSNKKKLPKKFIRFHLAIDGYLNQFNGNIMNDILAELVSIYEYNNQFMVKDFYKKIHQLAISKDLLTWDLFN